MRYGLINDYWIFDTQSDGRFRTLNYAKRSLVYLMNRMTWIRIMSCRRKLWLLILLVCMTFGRAAWFHHIITCVAVSATLRQCLAVSATVCAGHIDSALVCCDDRRRPSKLQFNVVRVRVRIGASWKHHRRAFLSYECQQRSLQDFHASWKVLDFFSWKFRDLESPGKISLKVVHVSSDSNGKQAAIVYHPVCVDYCLLRYSVECWWIFSNELHCEHCK